MLLLRCLALLLLTVGLEQAALGKTDTTRASSKRLAILFGAQLLNRINAGPFRTDEPDPYRKNAYYTGLMNKPMITLSLGVRSSKLTHLIDLCKYSNQSNYSADLNSNNWNAFYIQYQATLDLLQKSPSVWKPMIGISLSYMDKFYSFRYSRDTWPNDKYNYEDHSHSLNIQLPIGIRAYPKGFMFCMAFYLPVYAWVQGGYTDYSWGGYLNPVSEQHHINYSGDATRSSYSQANAWLSLRALISLDGKKRKNDVP